ncbi:hypothetical protein LTS10_004415 [Elasticomyces elasticus]|nr:hypothetical protein LTS10_004415 [Elasticomyces elasticus]
MSGDDNSYSFGRIGQHDVVIACLPAGVTGKASAATVAKDMMRSFPIRVGFMVGIGGGVWSDKKDVRLGDVVVSQPDGIHGGVVQWDFGKIQKEGVFRRTGTLDKPPRPLLSAVQSLRARHRRKGSMTYQYFEEMIAKYELMKEEYSSPGREHDELFEAGYSHPSDDDCAQCDRSRLHQRPQRRDDKPQIHYGNIASGDKVVKDGQFRDRIARAEEILCFEMEAAGLMDGFPCVVIRGICDYADSHKNKRWQPYAAATAACYCKELLGVIQPREFTELDLAKTAQYRIPFSLRGIPVTDRFVERDEEMKQLIAFFEPTSQPTSERTSEPKSQPAGRKVFVVRGLGGMGKTQLCVEFARKHRDNFSAILWLDGSSKEAVSQSLAEAFLRLPKTFRTHSEDIQLSIDGLLAWLELPDNTRWLMIFDNVDRDWQSTPKDPQAFNYRSFLPSADHGSILVTTRLSRMQIPEASLHLLRVDDRWAREMLETRVGKKLLDIDKILEKLGGLPLALVQAGAYLRQTNMSIVEYLEYYDRTWTTLMEFQYPLQDYREESVLTTWNMSYERVRAVYPQAAALLDQWAFLYAGDVWYELATSSRSAMSVAMDELTFHHSLGVLSDYSLVDADTEGTGFSIHPVVHAWCLHNVTGADMREKLCDRALVLIASMISPHRGDVNQWNKGGRLVPHARAAAAKHLEGTEKEQFNDCLKPIAYLLSEWDGPAEVEALYLRGLGRYIEAFGSEHMCTIYMLNRLGNLYSDHGKMKEAEEMYVRALGGQAGAWEARHMPNSLTLIIISNLGRLYAAQGRSKKAEEIYLRMLKRGEETTLAPGNPGNSDLPNSGASHARQGRPKNLGVNYHRQGELTKTRKIRVLEGYKHAAGEHEADIRDLRAESEFLRKEKRRSPRAVLVMDLTIF